MGYPTSDVISLNSSLIETTYWVRKFFTERIRIAEPLLVFVSTEIEDITYDGLVLSVKADNLGWEIGKVLLCRCGNGAEITFEYGPLPIETFDCDMFSQIKLPALIDKKNIVNLFNSRHVLKSKYHRGKLKEITYIDFNNQKHITGKMDLVKYSLKSFLDDICRNPISDDDLIELKDEWIKALSLNKPASKKLEVNTNIGFELPNESSGKNCSSCKLERGLSKAAKRSRLHAEVIELVSEKGYLPAKEIGRQLKVQDKSVNNVISQIRKDLGPECACEFLPYRKRWRRNSYSHRIQ